MMDLRTLQLQFKNTVTSANGIENYFLNSNSIIKDTPPISVAKRLSIYSYAYFARIRESLAEDFESVAKIIGPRCFESLVIEYLENYPSQYPLMVEIGQEFPHFLSNHSILIQFPFLSDLAQLEWLLIQVFHEKDDKLLTSQDLGAFDPEELPHLILTTAQSMHIFQSAWPIYKYLDQDGHDNCSYLIYRNPNGLARCKVICSFEAKILSFFSSGLSIVQLAERLTNCGKFDDLKDISMLQIWFSQWVQMGLFLAP